MSKKITAIAIALFLISAIVVPLYALPTADAQTTDWVQTYPFVIPIDNPVGVGQECLLWFGITDMCVWPQTGWKDLTITVTLPNNTTETLAHLNTDTTGGSGTTYIPTMEGTYYFQVHFPEQVNQYGDPSRPYPLPEGTVLKASDSEKVPLTVQQDPVPQHPGFPLPTEYWVRPINAQFREWASISGSYVFEGLPFTTGPDSLFQPYNEAPDTAHILWRRQDVLGGLVGGDSEITRFDDGTAYESKWHAIIVGGILLCDVPWPTLSHYQGVRAVDLRTGEELWFKEGIRAAFGQLMCWDTQDMHAVFGYLWEVQGSTWKAYDVYSGEWWFTMTNVPSGTRMVGPAGEILVYTVNLAKGWMTLWNSTNVPFLYGADDPNNPAVFPYYWGTWRPYGKTVNATGPFPITPNTLELPTGYAGYMWNKTIPTGLVGSVRHVEDGIIIGTSNQQWDVAQGPIERWAISTKPSEEGRLLWDETEQIPGNLTEDIRVVSVEEGVFVVGIKETRQFVGYSLDTGKKLWGPTESQEWGDWVGFGQRNWAEAIAYGKLYTGSYGGVVYAYDVQTGDLLWNHTVTDDYGESLMGPNWAFGLYFIADGKVYLGHFEHSSFDPFPRGSPSLCLNATTGELLWQIDIRTGNSMGAGGDAALPVIGDGVMVIQNSYDMCDYAIARGPSATTVSAGPKISMFGDGVLVEGLVTDISPGTADSALTMRFPNGVPAVSDESQSAWMEYVYMQYPRPTDVTGVEVVITVIDPNNNCYEVGRTTANADGVFGCAFKPEVPGAYEVIASFGGSGSYYGSHASTYITVEEAPEATPESTPQPASMADLYILPGITGIIVAIAVVGAIIILMLRKR